MTPEQYYITPDQIVFDEIKKAATEIWETYEDPYKTEKLNRIKDIQNISDNAWYLVAMFDWKNQAKLLQLVSPETAELVRDAMKGE